MKEYQIKSSILVILFIVYFTCHAYALTLTPYFGGYRFEGNSNVGDTLVIGLGADFQLTDNFAADLIYLKGDSDLNYFDIDSQRCMTQKSNDTNIFHISGRYHLLKGTHFMPYITSGLGILSMNTDYAKMFKDHPDRHYLFQFHYGGGIKFLLTDTISLRGDIRHMISFDNMDNDLSAIFGISYTFGSPANTTHKQEDFKKSVPEKKDPPPIKTNHPDTHATTDAHNKSQVTPTKVSLEAKETEKDIQKQTEPSQQVAIETVNKDVTVESLPKITSESKTATDQIGAYREHTLSQDKSLIDKKQNNELKMDYVDTDADGVYDHVDRCPNTPRNVKVNLFGCAPDHDRDGVIDILDHCPGTPANTKVDQNGCRIKAIQIPDRQVEIIPQVTQKYQTTIEFDYKSAQVKNIYIVQISKIMQKIKNPDHLLIIINSHTDNIGSQIYNINLSEQRADSVKQFFQHRFQIPDHLIKTYSFGETQPIADNATEEGRQKNRRAEIIISEN
jgi:OOP family OmpA-OmpF porin